MIRTQIDDAPSAMSWVKAGPIAPGSELRHRTGPIREPQEIVEMASEVPAAGGGNSGNRTAVTAGDLVLFDRLPAVLAIDPLRMSGYVNAGKRYGEPTSKLYRSSLAVEKLSSTTYISVADAIFSGVHEPGNRDELLSGAVTSVAAVHSSVTAEKGELRCNL